MKVNNFSKFFKLLDVVGWTRRLFVCLIILMFLTQSTSCMNNVVNLAKSKVVVFNKSKWPILMWTKLEKNGVKIASGNSYFFDEAPAQLKFKTYGEWIGAGALVYMINIEKVLCNKGIFEIPNNKDINIIIDTNWFSQWVWNIFLANKADIKKVLAIVPASGDPWDVFADIKVKRGNWPTMYFVEDCNWKKPVELARYIIGLGTNYSDKDLQERSTQLLNIWSSQDVFARRVTAIVKRAKDILMSKKGNFGSEILEYKKSLLRNRDQLGRSFLCNMLSKGQPMKCGNCLNKSGYLNQTGALCLSNIINLMWYFYSIALNKNQDFTEGTFVIEDPNYRIYDFLLNYVKAVNLDVKGTVEDQYCSVKPYAYARKSSHFPFEKEKYERIHYGIDMVKVGPLTLELPTPSKRHILFGKLGEDNKIFIKLETHGLCGLQSMAGHGASFVVAQLRKRVPAVAGSDDDPDYRKERIIKGFIKKCSEILNVATVINYEQLKNIRYDYTFNPDKFKFSVKQYLLGQIRIKGMQSLYSLVHDNIILPDRVIGSVCQYLTIDEKKALRRYLKKLEEEYDNMNMRYGREIIITHKDLNSRC